MRRFFSRLFRFVFRLFIVCTLLVAAFVLYVVVDDELSERAAQSAKEARAEARNAELSSLPKLEIRTFRDCDECPLMAEVPEKSFAIGVYEVTRGEYKAFVNLSGWAPDPLNCVSRGRRSDRVMSSLLNENQMETWEHPGFDQTDAHPVTCVSFDDAEAYVQWLGEMTGQDYRLPSAGDWRHIARAGTPTKYYWGDILAPDKANYEGGNRNMTLPVGSFPPSRFGLYDVIGNVCEWVEYDSWDENISRSPTSRRCLGGGWSSTPRHTREIWKDSRYTESGIRVVREMEP
jgi:formylglycine-generating enzyme required for sulfatase activity